MSFAGENELSRGRLTRFDALHLANNLYNLKDIQDPLTVVHQSRLADLIHPHERSEARAGVRAARLITDRLKANQTVIIGDNSHREVIVLESVYPDMERIQLSSYKNASSGADGLKIIDDPEIKVEFDLQGRRPELNLRIGGRVFGKKDAAGDAAMISSNGTYSPPSFTVATPHELLIARVDAHDSIGCAWAYQGDARWVITGTRSIPSARR